jgi:hypothetical protein
MYGIFNSCAARASYARLLELHKQYKRASYQYETANILFPRVTGAFKPVHADYMHPHSLRRLDRRARVSTNHIVDSRFSSRTFA